MPDVLSTEIDMSESSPWRSDRMYDHEVPADHSWKSSLDLQHRNAAPVRTSPQNIQLKNIKMHRCII